MPRADRVRAADGVSWLKHEDGRLERRLPPRVSMTVLASIAAMFSAPSNASTPLYAVYAREWNLTAATTSLVFGVYPLALLVALLTVGRLSDHLGRRPVLLASLAAQLVAMIVFATADGLSALILGRVLQGLSTGLGVSAVAAALVDIDEELGATTNSVAPPMGTAFGALGAAVVVEFLPAPARVVYLGFAAVLFAQSVLLLIVPDSSPHHPGAMRSLRPVVRLPAASRLEMLAAAPVLFAIWAFSGLFGSLGPRLIEEMSGSTSAIYGALPLSVFGVIAPAAGYLTRAFSPRLSLALSIGALLCGAALVIVAATTATGYLLLASAVMAGIGFGMGFRGGVQLVVPAAPPSQRAGAVSSLYIVSYLGFGVPAMIAGQLVVRTGNVATTTVDYGTLLIGLAAVAALILARTHSIRSTL